MRIIPQVMHVGPFEKEAGTVAAVHEFIDEQGGTKTGKHHEIYLSDMRKVPTFLQESPLRPLALAA